MNKKFIWTVILLLVIGGIVFFLIRKPNEEVQEDGEDTTSQVEEEQEEEEEVAEEEEEYTGATDFSTFSTEEQTLGEASEAVFQIESLEESSKDGFHEFIFLLKSENSDEPFVTAVYISAMGIIRMDFQGISKDSTGIGYQSEQSIDKDGVLRIYHNVSAQSDQELYDIGVTKSTPFKLSSESLEDGEWKVILQVKYPGEKSVDINLGIEEYTSFDQEIAGVGVNENASITSYTYGRPSGLLKLVWSVSADGDNPIPSVKASYNLENELVVTFESLVLDRVASFSESMSLSSGITATPERTGETSVYTFTGLGEKREFRLSASLSPNQVILEIK